MIIKGNMESLMNLAGSAPSLYEGILSDIDTTIKASDDFTNIYNVFDKLLNSNENNFKSNLDKFVKDIKNLGATLIPKRKGWYNLGKNWVLVERKQIKEPKNGKGGIYDNILFVIDIDKDIWGEICLCTNPVFNKSKLIYLSHKYNALGNISKESYYDYFTYDRYKLPTDFEPVMKLILDKINEKH